MAELHGFQSLAAIVNIRGSCEMSCGYGQNAGGYENNTSIAHSSSFDPVHLRSGPPSISTCDRSKATDASGEECSISEGGSISNMRTKARPGGAFTRWLRCIYLDGIVN